MCLAEAPTLKQGFVLTLVVSFVLGFVFTGKTGIEEGSSLSGETDSIQIYAWSCLLLSPPALAMGSILNRAMRKLNENTVSIYSNFVQIPT